MNIKVLYTPLTLLTLLTPFFFVSPVFGQDIGPSALEEYQCVEKNGKFRLVHLPSDRKITSVRINSHLKKTIKRKNKLEKNKKLSENAKEENRKVLNEELTMWSSLYERGYNCALQNITSQGDNSNTVSLKSNKTPAYLRHPASRVCLDMKFKLKLPKKKYLSEVKVNLAYFGSSSKVGDVFINNVPAFPVLNSGGNSNGSGVHLISNTLPGSLFTQKTVITICNEKPQYFLLHSLKLEAVLSNEPPPSPTHPVNTPFPVTTSTPQPSPSKTPTPKPAATKTPTPKATATKAPTPKPAPTKTPTPNPSPTKTPTPKPTPTKTPTPKPTPTNTPVPPSSGGFVHPGMLNTQAELDTIRQKVLANENPWADGYRALSLHNGSTDLLSREPSPAERYVDLQGHSDPNDTKHMNWLTYDARAAYALALKWVVTRDSKYSKKAIAILEAWSGKLKSIDTQGDGALSTSYGWPAMIWAAEILRTSPDWSASRVKAFGDFLNNVVRGATQYVQEQSVPDSCWTSKNTWTSCFGKGNNNWAAWGVATRISIAVFRDDRNQFNQAVSDFKKVMDMYVNQQGKTLETCREGGDIHHSMMGIAPLLAAAIIAENQGVRLFDYRGARGGTLLAALEYHAPYIDYPRRGSKSGWSCELSLEEASGKGFPIWEMANSIFGGSKIKSVVNDMRPEGWNRIGWGSMTHAVK